MKVRKLDGKFHIEAREVDGKVTIRIVKTSNGEAIPEDEPVIIIRARDRLALPLLDAYATLSSKDGCNDFHMQGIDSVIESFREFRDRNPEKMKQPGITRGL